MSDQIKISQEELNSLLDLRERIRTNVESIGRLNIKRHFTGDRSDSWGSRSGLFGF